MGEPWLDSLSEDWDSEPRLSSPAPSLNGSKYGSHDFKSSQSRIPHLAHNISRASSGGSFLKPRSSRGIAKAKGLPILSERSPSSLNLPRISSQDASLKKLPLPNISRTASSNFSESQQSVQHHSVKLQSQDTPEWKKRIKMGEDIASDGFDLFSPSKLEGMFAQPARSTPEQRKLSSPVAVDSKPWSSLKTTNTQQSSDQFNSYRTTRSRAPLLECLPELSEEDGHGDTDYGLSAISSDIVRNGSIRGLVSRRVSDLEQAHFDSSPRRAGDGSGVHSSNDPRWRTISGQEEMRNEELTPLTASSKNTISSRAMRESIDLDPQVLREKLLNAEIDRQNRPSSRSSDRDISYGQHGSNEESMLHEEHLPDLTSHSLPEDLSMGTQDFVSNGGYINMKRGPGSTDVSFWKKNISLMEEPSQMQEQHARVNRFRSSPPPYDTSKHSSVIYHKDVPDSPFDSQENSVVHHDTKPQQPASASSPLKLFGNRDTYTNNKLLRVLSQYEEDGSDQSRSLEGIAEVPVAHAQLDSEIHMSQFGMGELDTYNFEKEVTRPSPDDTAVHVAGEKIFQALEKLSISQRPTNAAKVLDNGGNDSSEDPYIKRQPSSPARERTPKRRRTLLRDEIAVGGIDLEIKVQQVQEIAAVTGQKRKDSRPGEAGAPADPTILASRSILQPRPGSRKPSGQSQQGPVSEASTVRRVEASNDLTQALAAELASFAQGASHAHQDSRKPSLATKDYMEEANKVMEFIRARGKPKHSLPDVQETLDLSALDADKILDMEVEDDSTVEPFSRPPSREGPVKPREDRRVAKHDPRTASHLRKFKDSDDLDLLAIASTINTIPSIANRLNGDSAQRRSTRDSQESSPANIRILNDNQAQRTSRHADSSGDNSANTGQSSERATCRSFATESSNNSGQRGVITYGKVTIPDNIGTMTFDREKQIWVRQTLDRTQQEKSSSRLKVKERSGDTSFEDDPFEDIPDLSIDEQHEAAIQATSKPTSRSSTTTVQRMGDSPPVLKQDDQGNPVQVQRNLSRDENLYNENPADFEENKAEIQGQNELQHISSIKSRAGKHQEIDDKESLAQPPKTSMKRDLQPRVVTIAFSSPIASDIPQPVIDISEPASDDEDYLPPDDSDDDMEYLHTPKATSAQEDDNLVLLQKQSLTSTKHQQYRSMTLNRRPVSRIEERDEEAGEEGLSLIPLHESRLATPAPIDKTTTTRPVSAYKGASILCLTPLSEFTMHQADSANHPEESFVQQRAHPKALLQAHGALALSVDTLMKAITDAVPHEPYWEQIRQLDLNDGRLQSVHGLADYCSALEVLNVSRNRLSQLDGMPSSIRKLDVSHNLVNDFTSWSHLQNLQSVDVSKNQLENLEGFSSLVHLRKLNAGGNKILDIEGVLDLDGLISLDLQDNRLNELDFEGADMPDLENLDLSNNQLKTVRNLQCLPRLKKLKLGGNCLRDLGVTEPLPKLRVLVLSENELEEIDLAMFPALVELDLDGNCIKTMKGLSNAKCLRSLSLRNQRNSCNIANSVLSTPNECSKIFLSSNIVPQGQMQLPRYPHYNLQHLELAACGLSSLPQGLGDYFPNCRILNLNFNAISEVSPLIGCIKLQDVLLAGNRIKRLRRTCLALSRMPAIRKVDIRNNPLTIGFYAPEYDGDSSGERHVLPNRSAAQDARWQQLLDETTGLKRKMMELLLVENCKSLQEMDGLPINREATEEDDQLWHSLKSTGVLMRAIEAPPQVKEVEGLEDDVIVDVVQERSV